MHAERWEQIGSCLELQTPVSPISQASGSPYSFGQIQPMHMARHYSARHESSSSSSCPTHARRGEKEASRRLDIAIAIVIKNLPVQGAGHQTHLPRSLLNGCWVMNERCAIAQHREALRSFCGRSGSTRRRCAVRDTVPVQLTPFVILLMPAVR